MYENVFVLVDGALGCVDVIKVEKDPFGTTR